MLKVIKITFYMFFLLVLLEVVFFVRDNSATIGSSMQKMGSDFMNTAQQILNEGNTDVNNSLNTINF
ncbi:MAG: hypothetical protein IKN71_05060 [Alphaproteobacteria bacterium]|nr:hypothetical protein [Alphaproteobacteria bacterium]